jgi:hypothetical protein
MSSPSRWKGDKTKRAEATPPPSECEQADRLHQPGNQGEDAFDQVLWYFKQTIIHNNAPPSRAGHIVNLNFFLQAKRDIVEFNVKYFYLLFSCVFYGGGLV